ncbi:MAG: hypothetical protein GQ474_10680 [Sulfurimonas sp.]|nr:hypothetical protein [Sulfurimonas sp.]
MSALYANTKEILVMDKGVSAYPFFIDNAKDKTDLILLEQDADGLKQIVFLDGKVQELGCIA